LLDGRYRVDTVIASGGMSTVYRGHDVRLDRPVALKVMDARYAGDHQFLTRFQREARAIARLKNPGLVAIYDQGGDAADPFLVMELVEGGTLRELLRERGPMPPHAVVAVLRPVLGGLGEAHRAGLVHRDIKPENVLISDDGEVKLVDFGLVRAIAEAGITSTSVILGTAAYLSPEQVVGSATGPRSDVYSAGIMAFELLTGTTPFRGDNALTRRRWPMDWSPSPRTSTCPCSGCRRRRAPPNMRRPPSHTVTKPDGQCQRPPRSPLALRRCGTPPGSSLPRPCSENRSDEILETSHPAATSGRPHSNSRVSTSRTSPGRATARGARWRSGW
jgi:serine/threonine protein kinase